MVCNSLISTNSSILAPSWQLTTLRYTLLTNTSLQWRKLENSLLCSGTSLLTLQYDNQSSSAHSRLRWIKFTEIVLSPVSIPLSHYYSTSITTAISYDNVLWLTHPIAIVARASGSPVSTQALHSYSLTDKHEWFCLNNLTESLSNST